MGKQEAKQVLWIYLFGMALLLIMGAAFRWSWVRWLLLIVLGVFVIGICILMLVGWALGWSRDEEDNW